MFNKAIAIATDLIGPFGEPLVILGVGAIFFGLVMGVTVLWQKFEDKFM